MCIIKNLCWHVCSLVGHDVHIPRFSGHSYLQYEGLNRRVLSYTEIEVVFKPMMPDGSILYNGYTKDRKGDFISLALRDGIIEFSFDLGTGPAVIRSEECENIFLLLDNVTK